MTKMIDGADYEFPDAEKSNEWNPHVWITVKNLSVCLKQTDEGVVVDVYPLNKEDVAEPITSTYAFFAEGKEDNDNDI